MRSLVVVNDQPIRRNLARELAKLHKSYQRIWNEIEHHKNRVRPSFHQWYFERFGTRAQLIEKLRSQFEEKMMLLQRMRDLYTWRGLTRQKAFAQATEDLEALKDSGLLDDEDPVEDDVDEDIFDDPIDDDPWAADATVHAWAPDLGDDSQEPAPASMREKEIKSFYRRLARALHPDKGAEQTEALRQLWEETQKAYQDEDLDRLKVIWTECILAVDPMSSELLVSDMISAMERIKSKIKIVQKERRELSKSDPTWGFQRKNKEILAREISFELMHAETELNGSIRMLDREIRAFSGPTRRPAKRRNKDLEFDRDLDINRP